MAKLTSALQKLTALLKETDWIEFKHNFHSLKEIGERISALANTTIMMAGYNMFYVPDYWDDCEYVKLK